jgi:DNA-binding NtrC family response regulator
MQIQPPVSNDSQISSRPVLVFNKDLFFGVTIINTLRTLGYDPRTARTAESLTSALAAHPEAALVIVDITAVDDWDALKRALDGSPDIPAIAFGSHTNVDGLRSAKRIGMTRVFSNGEFHRTMGDTISRYARSNT